MEGTVGVPATKKTKKKTNKQTNNKTHDKKQKLVTSPPPPATLLSFSRKSATSARMDSELRAKSDEEVSMLE